MAEEIIGIIGGSGLGKVLAGRLSEENTYSIETPFGKTSDAILVGNMGNRKIAFITRHGSGHKFAPGDVPYAANIYALKKLGVKTIIASGAVGSLREDIKPKELVMVNQFIDKTYKRRSSYFEGLAAVHCEMAQPVCTRLRNAVFNAAEDLDIKVHPAGTYVNMEGPQFSTRAESLMHQKWGGDLIGMTAATEAKLAREAQICYTLIALISDYDCWHESAAETDKQTLLKEIVGNLGQATDNAIKLIEKFLTTERRIDHSDCPCRKSLELAMWTANDRLTEKEKKNIEVLFE